MRLGVKCGGSDGFSSITANPALGAAIDILSRHGGTGILSETPEIYGAEHLLINRANKQETADKLIAKIKWWQHYTSINNSSMDNNPAPGNKKGGLTTILEKSLGAVAKGGNSILEDVLSYAEPLKNKGFNFMDSPGYDPVSVTGQVASGANVICFTTGRGSCFGCKPAPSLKLSTNTTMYEKMIEDMDINCGTIIEGKEEIEEVARLSHCDVFIDNFPQKYKQVVGERGIKLSVGQKQRVAIARAMLRDPKILILDEPTEGIQPSIIREMVHTLRRIRDERGLSILVSEQVLSFALDVSDRVMVIEKGDIVHQESSATADHKKIAAYLSV